MSQEVLVGSLDELKLGQFKILKAGGREIGVVLDSGGKVHAILNYCPHRGAPICKGVITGTALPCEPGKMSYGMEGHILKCPWHGYEYDLDSGQAVFNMSKLRIMKFESNVRDGNVYVKLP